MFYFLILEIHFQNIQIDIRWNRIDEIQFTMLTLDWWIWKWRRYIEYSAKNPLLSILKISPTTLLLCKFYQFPSKKILVKIVLHEYEFMCFY